MSKQLIEDKPHLFWIKKLIIFIWLPAILLGIGGLFLAIGYLYNPNPNAPSKSNALSSLTLTFKTIGEILLFRVSALIFAISIVYTFVKTDRGSAVLIVVVGYITFVGVMAGMTNLWRITPYNTLTERMTANTWDMNTDAAHHINSTLGFTIGKYAPESGWLGAFIIGISVTYIFNATYQYKAPAIIGFFSGTRFTPVVVVIASACIGLIYFFTWYIIQVDWLNNFKAS